VSQLSTFHVGAYLFGVEVALVQEIVRMQTITPVPLSESEIAGLINLRGEVLTAVDVRSRLGLPLATSERPQINVVVRVDDEPVSLLVDEIGGVIEVSTVTFEATPSTVDPVVRPLILGAYTLPDQLLLLLDARKLLALSESPAPAGV
jgi:purine-binding chemotaxis protein CheW